MNSPRLAATALLIAAGFMASACATDPGGSAAPSATASAPVTAPAESPTPADSLGVLPLGGDCANALSPELADATAGMPMQLLHGEWQDGAVSALGGIQCLWLSTEVFLATQIDLYVYPESSVAAHIREAQSTSCAADLRSCKAVGVTDGMWVSVEVTSRLAAAAPSAEPLYLSVIAALSDYPPALAATRTAQWWALPNCEDVAAAAQAGLGGTAAVVAWPDSQELAPWKNHPGRIPHAADIERQCTLSVEVDGVASALMSVSLIAGGAIEFDSVLGASNTEKVEVAGASLAMWAPDNLPYDGTADYLVATDGVNVLLVRDAGQGRDPQLTSIATEVLDMVSP